MASITWIDMKKKRQNVKKKRDVANRWKLYRDNSGCTVRYSMGVDVQYKIT